ncbi:MAG: biotin--[acetyl-CoA-carboxylase] ligase [Roseobacter sp.]|jgi:BirA family biotin operon repressor/biotin-[acetyl-CoA-carboxylase] ligase|nr:biotin--[acetyl-CoA-carboxylase] ligase [Roseobacter sp.]
MTDWPAGYGRVVLAEVGSTLDEARRVATEHAGPVWIMAHRQTAARGRRGRAWSMPAGNFAATLVLALNEPPAQRALRSFVMSLALYRSCVELTGDDGAFALKWPNDLLLNGGKVAGILLESLSVPEGLAIGVGVNLADSPTVSEVEEGAVPPVSILRETGTQIGPEHFLDTLARHYASCEARFQTYGFSAIRSSWLAHAARIGEEVTARTGRETITGTFEDVDADGHLVLRGARGVSRIAAADVYF